MKSRATSRIAILLTCHNRRATTLRCLEALFAQDVREGAALHVFLVDDGSVDGTREAVRARFPPVQVIQGDGTLFWCGGMRLAFEAALKASEDFHYYLWLNDDTLLYRDALRRLVATHQELIIDGRAGSIVVGSTIDPNTERPTYGGMRRLWPLPFVVLVRPESKRIRCATMNGNCVLIPGPVADDVGTIDPALTHLCGDLDYGLRAAANGYEIWIAPDIYGTCEFNTAKPWQDVRLPIRQRFEALRLPRYSLAEKCFVARRHFGLLWFLTPLAHYTYVLLTHLLRWRSGRRQGASSSRPESSF